MPPSDPEKSLGGDATFAGSGKPSGSSPDVSLGDERTLGDSRSGQNTVIDDIEVIDLEARYKVEGTLGQGGMGAVLLATDTRLDRRVAIKRILGEAAGNRMAVQRFLTEAKAIAAINHPNVVQIHDYGRAKDGPFLIMEYVDGGSLLDRCRESALPIEEAIDIACQLCDGLAKAHDLGIIHRDIKPANVLLTKDGIPKLTDFGLAKAQASDHGQTMTGAVLGTPDFMPPEQRRDASLVDHRSDLWSLAATIYQMVTGRSPKIIRFDLLPAALTKVLGKALEDAKESRYQTARELRDALKVSLRSAAPATIATVGEGQCPACGVQNDSKRKFCRGCGGLLESPCLKCSEPMPVWEEICGSCGAKQTPIVESRRVEMAAAQAKAEGLLGDLAFDEAIAIATRLHDEPHPRLCHLQKWAETFVEEVGKARAHQIERAAESLAEALKHEAAYDYLSGVATLESIPDAMRSVALPGAREPVAAAIARLSQKQAASRRLETLLRERIAAKSIDGLLPEVDELLVLHPNRQDVRRLRQQLIDRQQRQAAARDESLRKATALVEAHDYEGALTALSGVAAAASTAEVTNLRKQASIFASEAQDLATSIRRAQAAGKLDGLLTSLDRYLQLKPAEPEFVALRQSIVAHQQAIDGKRRSLVTYAEKLLAEYRYQEAAHALDEMSAEIETPALLQLRSRVRNTLIELSGLRSQIRSALAEKSLEGLLDTVNRYLRLNPNDGEARALMQKLFAREEELAKDFEAFCTNVRSLLEVGNWREALVTVRQRKPRSQEMSSWTKQLSMATAVRDAEYAEALVVRTRRTEAWNKRGFLAVLILVFVGPLFLVAATALYFVPSIAILQSARAWSWALVVGSGVQMGAFGICVHFPFLWRVPLEVAACVAAYGAIVMLGGDRVLQQGYAAACIGSWVLDIGHIWPFLFTNIDRQIALLESLGAAEPPAHKAPVTTPTRSDLVLCPDCGASVSPHRLATHLAEKCNARRYAKSILPIYGEK